MSEAELARRERYARDMAEHEARVAAEAARKAATRHVGTVGAPITLTVTVEAAFSAKGAYGSSHLRKCRDEAGNAVVWFSSWSCDEGERVTVTGTVKEHGYYADEAQTTLARVKAAR